MKNIRYKVITNRNYRFFEDSINNMAIKGWRVFSYKTVFSATHGLIYSALLQKEIANDEIGGEIKISEID